MTTNNQAALAQSAPPVRAHRQRRFQASEMPGSKASLSRFRKAPSSCCLVLCLLFLVFLIPLQLPAEPQELVFWNFWDQKFILPVIEKFEKRHPGIHIRSEQLSWNNGFDKLVMAIAGGRGPDICELGSTWTGRFMASKAVLDITESVQDLKAAYHLQEATVWNNRIYGLPWLVSTRVLFYNRALFRQAGLDPDQPPRSWPELLRAAEKLYRLPGRFFGIGINAGEGHVLYKKLLPFIWALDGNILDADGNWAFSSGATRDALYLFQRLLPFGFREKQDLLDEAFLSGRLGMEISGSWLLARQKKEAPHLDLGVGLIPAPSRHRGHTSSFMGGQVLVLLKGCRHPSLAVEFIRFLTLPEQTLPITKETMVSFPAHRDAYQDPFFQNPQIAVFVEQLKTAVHPPIHPLWGEIEFTINQTLERALAGQSIDHLLQSAAQQFEHLRSRNRLRQPLSSGTQASPPPAGSEQDDSASGHSPMRVRWLVFSAIIFAFLGTLFFIFRPSLTRSHASITGPVLPQVSGQSTTRHQETLLFLLPWLLTFSIFWVYPILFSLILAGCDYDIFNPAQVQFVGLAHFSRLWNDAAFTQAFGNTLFFGFASTTLLTVTGFTLAFLLHRQKALEGLFRSVFFLPSLLSVIVVATIFKALYSPLGPINALLEGMGGTSQGWLTDSHVALFSIIMLDVWAATGFSVVLFLAGFKAIPRQLYEAAAVDGAEEWDCFRHITLPQMRPMMLFVIIINTVRTWQVFPEVFVLTRGGPLGTTDTIVHRLYETAFRFHDLGYASAMAYTLTAVLLFLSWVKMRTLKGRED